jgi:hypothetical protein
MNNIASLMAMVLRTKLFLKIAEKIMFPSLEDYK